MSELIHDRGRGPELIGTRVTVYSLIPYFLDASFTEEQIAHNNGITIEQVAAVRAYVLNHFADVMAVHERIEARNARGNPPEVEEFLARSRGKMQLFKRWMEERDAGKGPNAPQSSQTFPTFEQWLTERQSRVPHD